MSLAPSTPRKHTPRAATAAATATAASTGSTPGSLPGRNQHSGTATPALWAEVYSLEEARIIVQVKAFVRGVVQSLMEALDGVRPLTQLARCVSPTVFDALLLRRTLVEMKRSAGPAKNQAAPATAYAEAKVRSVHAQLLGPGVVEACLLVTTARQRARAVAIRVESRKGAWMVTALEIG